MRLDREGFAGPDYDGRYRRDDAGNLTKIAEVAPGQQAETQCFDHDYLRRLTAAWTPASGDCSAAPSSSTLGGPAPYWHSFGYDAIGNRTVEVRHATAAGGTDTRREYTYPAAGGSRPHALSSVTSTGPGGTDLSAYTYDDAGNGLTRPGPNGTQTLSWDADGHLGKVSDGEGETSYVYDANGDRLLRRDPNATTLYLDGAEITLDRATGAKSSTRYYEHLGKTIAVRTSKPGSTVGTVKFLLADHHGTAEVAVDSYTQELTRRRFDPFGNPRGEEVPWSGERGFVGGTLDASTGLTHLGAREYDPRTGRFVSVDPIIDPGDPQQMHGYAYANNSPATFSDPDGLRFTADNEGKVVATPEPSGGYSIYDERTGTRTGANASKKNLEKAEDRLNRARAEQERLKRKLINAGKLFLDILLEVTGAKAGIDCFLKGDVGGCVETAVTVISGLVGGLLVKIGAKYALKWKAAAKLAGKVAKLVTDIADVIKGWGKAAKGVADATKNLLKARKAAKAAKTETELVQRWMSRAELDATIETGLVRGGRDGTHYVTDFANHSAQRARQRLALPQTPEVRVQLEVPRGAFSPAKRVDPAYNMPGGGMERTATGPVTCRVVCVWD